MQPEMFLALLQVSDDIREPSYPSWVILNNSVALLLNVRFHGEVYLIDIGATIQMSYVHNLTEDAGILR